MARRTPVWREVEAAEARRLTNRVRRANRNRRRLTVVYDIEGPRVRLGVAWFVLAMAALAFGVVATALLYGAAAALAAHQTARMWHKKKSYPNARVAAAGAAAMAAGAAVSTGMLGVALLAYVVAALVVAPPLATAARTVQSGVFAGAAAASVVCLVRFEIGAAVAVVLVASAYETGDYLIGSGSRNALEGPVAGAAAVLVVQFALSALGVPPFELPSGLAFAALGAVLCPLGQLVASLVLPSTRAPAPALRRIDSLLLLGPAWAVLAGAAAA